MEKWLNGSKRRLPELWGRGSNLCSNKYFETVFFSLSVLSTFCVGFCVCEIGSIKQISSQSRLPCLWVHPGVPYQSGGKEWHGTNHCLAWIALFLTVMTGFGFWCFRNLRRYWVENGYTAGYTLFHGLGEVGVPSIHSSDKDKKFWGMVSTQLSIYF